MLPILLNVPETTADFSRFSFANFDNHAQIITQINTRFALSLPAYPIDPIPSFDTKSWLEHHQQMHNDFNAVLNTGGADLADVDFTDKKQLRAWLLLHFTEHYNASNFLRIA